MRGGVILKFKVKSEKLELDESTLSVDDYELEVIQPDLMDYKVFCFDGEVKMIEVDYDRFTEHKRNLYTPEWERMEATIGFPTDTKREFEKPKSLNTLLEVSSRLSKGFPHIRTDFYILNEKVLFGELTFYHGSGYEKTSPESLNKLMGDWIKLPPAQCS